jgi:hypothetical protein
LRLVMFSWATTAPEESPPSNGVTLAMNQRRSLGEWQGYSRKPLI